MFSGIEGRTPCERDDQHPHYQAGRLRIMAHSFCFSSSRPFPRSGLPARNNLQIECNGTEWEWSQVFFPLFCLWKPPENPSRTWFANLVSNLTMAIFLEMGDSGSRTQQMEHHEGMDGNLRSLGILTQWIGRQMAPKTPAENVEAWSRFSAGIRVSFC